MTTQLNYDASKLRVLGIGERIEQGDFCKLRTADFEDSCLPVSYSVGEPVNQDDSLIFLRPINTAADITTLAASLGIKTDIGRKALEIALANIRLLDSKQQDYGSENIAAFGEYGVLVRTWDKVSRLKNLLRNVQDPKNESLEDSWVDLSNYAVIALLCRRGLWK